MRLIDADALVWTFVRIVSPSGDQADVSVPDIAAAPTIPTTTKKNGVTSCAFCGGVVDIEYMDYQRRRAGYADFWSLIWQDVLDAYARLTAPEPKEKP